MDDLILSVDTEATHIDQIKRKSTIQDKFVEAVTKFVAPLKPGEFKRVNGPKIKPRTIQARVLNLRKEGVLPSNIAVTASGNEIWLGKKAE